jgi:hypothetical protein
MRKGTSTQPNGFFIDTGVVVVKPADLSGFLAQAPH